jgi:hypothetical protein
MADTHIRHDPAAPLHESPTGHTLQITIVLDARAANWIVQRARLEGLTPEAMAENIIESLARKHV